MCTEKRNLTNPLIKIGKLHLWAKFSSLSGLYIKFYCNSQIDSLTYCQGLLHVITAELNSCHTAFMAHTV